MDGALAPHLGVTLSARWLLPGRARVSLERVGAEGVEVLVLGEVEAVDGVAWRVVGHEGRYERFREALRALLLERAALIVEGLS